MNFHRTHVILLIINYLFLQSILGSTKNDLSFVTIVTLYCFFPILVVLLFNNERLFVNNPPLLNNTRPLFEKDDNCFCRSK